MNSKELFALFLRLVGVLGIIFILRHALDAIPSWSLPVYLLIIKWVIGVCVGIYMIRGAPLVVKFAFPDKPGTAA